MERISSRILFVDKKIQKSFEDLQKEKYEERELYKNLKNAFDNLKTNVYSGIQIPKRLIPKIYLKRYNIGNLFKYDLPKGWRLIYSVVNKEIFVISLILEWLDHKEYERRFKY